MFSLVFVCLFHKMCFFRSRSWVSLYGLGVFSGQVNWGLPSDTFEASLKQTNIALEKLIVFEMSLLRPFGAKGLFSGANLLLVSCGLRHLALQCNSCHLCSMYSIPFARRCDERGCHMRLKASRTTEKKNRHCPWWLDLHNHF